MRWKVICEAQLGNEELTGISIRLMWACKAAMFCESCATWC